METWTNNNELQKKGLTLPGEIFFFQRWAELLHVKTLDTYQSSAMNTHGALNELLDILNDIHAGIVHEANLKDAIAETLKLLKTDDVFKKHAPHIYQRMLHHLGTKPNASKDLRLKYQIENCLERIQDEYLTWLLDDLRVAIEERQYDQIDHISTRLASECIANGWSTLGLRTLGRECFLTARPFSDKWIEFCQRLKVNNNEYVCFFKLTIRQEKTEELFEIFKSVGLQISHGAELITEFSSLTDIMEKDAVFVISRVHALDIIVQFMGP
jgi:hypothetical protein